MTRPRGAASAAVAGASFVAIAVLTVGWVEERPPRAFGTMPAATDGLRSRAQVPLPVPIGAAIGTYPARLDQLVVPDRVEPVALRVEAAGISAEVRPVGVDASGTAMAVPPDGSVVAWYRDGPSPGESGSAVLAGHVDYGGQRGALFDLVDVGMGAEIAVDFDDGSSRAFLAVGLRRYQKAELPTTELFRQQGPPVLVLITCGGSYDRQSRSYRENVVVFAIPTDRPRQSPR
jgi:hypothetical protein